jgi:hypothetical protein
MIKLRMRLREPQGIKPQQRPRGGWEDNITIYLNEIRCKSVDLIQNRVLWPALVNTATNVWIPLKMKNFLTN